MNLLIMRGRILPERYPLPAAARSLARQGLVGVHRHRARHTLEQRQVVMRVAVARALAEIGETAPEAGEPIVQPAHLAVAERRQPGDPPGKATVALLRFGGNKVLDAEGG